MVDKSIKSSLTQSVNGLPLQVEVTVEMNNYFNSPLDSNLFLLAVDSFVRISKEDFVKLFTAKFNHFVFNNNGNEKQKNQFLKALKLDLGKALMAMLGIKSEWFFKSRNKMEFFVGDIFVIAHAIRNKKLEPEVFELFSMKAEGSKACDLCGNMKETLVEHTALLKQLKQANDQLSGMMNKIINSSVFKTFGYQNLINEVSSEDPNVTRKKRPREDQSDAGSSELRLRANYQGAPSADSNTVSGSQRTIEQDSVDLSASASISAPNQTSGLPWQTAGPKRSRANRGQNGETPRRPNPISSNQPVGRKGNKVNNENQNKANRTNKSLVIGTSTDQNFMVKRALRNFHYSVGRFESNVDENMIKTFLSNKIGGELTVEKYQLKHDYFRVFRISCPETNHLIMTDPTTWPEGIQVKRFFFPKSLLNNAAAGNLLKASSPDKVSNDLVAVEKENTNVDAVNVMENE